MKTSFLSLALATLLAVACNNSPDTSTPATGNSEPHGMAKPIGTTDTRPVKLAGCYEMIFRRDTALLELQVQDSTVTGKLMYNLFEKDRNTGTIRGVLRNNLIVADYLFESEGMTSTREVVWRVQDEELEQAFGELEEKNGKVVFIDPSRLQYDSTHPFMKVPCDDQRG